jgi:hypothetical protein
MPNPLASASAIAINAAARVDAALRGNCVLLFVPDRFVSMRTSVIAAGS